VAAAVVSFLFFVAGRMGFSGSGAGLKGNYVIRLSPEYVCIAAYESSMKLLKRRMLQFILIIQYGMLL